MSRIPLRCRVFNIYLSYVLLLIKTTTLKRVTTRRWQVRRREGENGDLRAIGDLRDGRGQKTSSFVWGRGPTTKLRFSGTESEEGDVSENKGD